MHSLSGGLNDRCRNDLASCKVKENASNKLVISVSNPCILLAARLLYFLDIFHTFFYFGHYISDNVLFNNNG